MCQNICGVSFKNVTFLSEKLSWSLCLKVAPFLKKNITLLSKKPSCHLIGRHTICSKEFYSPKRKLNQLPLLKVAPCFAMFWKYVRILSITPFLWTKYSTPFKEPSCALLGQEHHLSFEGKVSFTKNIILDFQRLHTWKGKLHIPKECCACLAYTRFF